MTFASCEIVGPFPRRGINAVEETHREHRIAELRAMQLSNPRGLIEQYCKIAGELGGKQLPHGVSFSRMIEAIVDHEEQTEKSSHATD
jgi:hypothetical protein